MRIPEWCEKAEVCVGETTFAAHDGYCRLEKAWRDGDEITLRLSMTLRETHKNGKTAFTYGALALARDEAKEEGNITEEFVPEGGDNRLSYTQEKTEKDEQLRILLRCKDNKDVLLTDYASCGKNWTSPRNHVTLWTNAKQ